MKNKKWLMIGISVFVVLAVGIAAAAMLRPEEEPENSPSTERFTPVNVRHEGVKVLNTGRWGPMMAEAPGLKVKLSVDNTLFQGKTITFEVRADGPMECYYDYITGNVDMTREEAYLGNQFAVENGAQILWRVGDPCFFDIDGLDFFMDIVIKANGNPVGFAVVMLDRREPGKQSYDIRLLENELYPTVDGQLQDVTDIYIQQKIFVAKAQGFFLPPTTAVSQTTTITRKNDITIGANTGNEP